MREAHIEQCLVYVTERFCGQRPQHERMSKSGLPDRRANSGAREFRTAPCQWSVTTEFEPDCPFALSEGLLLEERFDKHNQ